jgi:hypothetical protein
VTDSKIATHAEPVGRNRTNFIVCLDLTDHGMPGHYEQMWTRTQDKRLLELCCIPFFTYGQSMGDILEVTPGTGYPVPKLTARDCSGSSKRQQPHRPQVSTITQH